MAWNEPGGSNNKDPWGNRNNQGPPDLDEVIKKLQAKFGGLFGGKGGGGGPRIPGAGGSIGLSFIALVLAAIWALSGIYIVNEGKEAVVLRFGEFQSIQPPGPHWHPRFIDTVEIVDVSNVRSVHIGEGSQEALMLTQDENIVDMEFVVQYNVRDSRRFLYHVRDPEVSLKHVTQSAVREIVGNNDMEHIITEGRDKIASEAWDRIQGILDSYETGLQVRGFNMQKAQPPRQVMAAFDDVAAAREDREKYMNQAMGFANNILPRAEGQAQRFLEEAKAYRDQKIAVAEGDAERFTDVLVEYKKAPAVTRERLYLEAIEEILGKTSKVMVDIQNGNNLMYLPLDQIMKRSKNSDTKVDSGSGPFQQQVEDFGLDQMRERENRSREERQ
ncbi:FtsH protease activity modulator HflK [Thiohalophilus thiocyanatoxydans]|uniref:Protein HflK n=1 Tax=Thiohalophilus thiocyanatoxydans TaxID=381308 RepID=A0A4R8IFI2_9GAMM|nr:FtsH protease activity modulator HflK [Thiohalophilus thiocyanatoxydans]TDX99275.1 protease FtsH subunit HflK [Thiohalophilus thiocyanatoxydans]